MTKVTFELSTMSMKSLTELGYLSVFEAGDLMENEKVMNEGVRKTIRGKRIERARAIIAELDHRLRYVGPLNPYFARLEELKCMIGSIGLHHQYENRVTHTHLPGEETGLDSSGNYWGYIFNRHGNRVRVCVPTT